MAENATLPWLVRPLWQRADCDPESVALVFVAEGGDHQKISAAELRASVERYARGLAASGVGAGDVVLVAIGHSRDLIDAILGSLALGAVPAIAPYVTGRLDADHYARRIGAMVDGAGARIAVVSHDLAERIGTAVAPADCATIDARSVALEADSAIPRAEVRDDDLAYLQFTSGSTGAQKAVAHTQRGMREYLRAKAAADGYTASDVVVSWLPLYHDLGLVSGLLMPAVTGVPSVLMSPVHWVRDPKILPWAIHDYRGTLVWMPNFALNHCVRGVRARDLEGLDLRSWKRLVLGGEPVRHESRCAFLERYTPYGFEPSALCTGYGMAENVEGISVTSIGQSPAIDWISRETLQRSRRALPVDPKSDDAMAVACCGAPMLGTDIRIAGDDGAPVPPRVVGEIAVRSPYCLTGGYHRRADLTRAARRGDWFLTGDLGYLADGMLYVCGRKKDLIIIGGHNVHPEEVETIVAEHAAVAAGRVVAFGVRDERAGTDRLVVACELRAAAEESERRAIEKELRERVVRRLDVALSEIRFVGRGWVVKTSSGKLARSANRDKHLSEAAGDAP